MTSQRLDRNPYPATRQGVRDLNALRPPAPQVQQAHQTPHARRLLPLLVRHSGSAVIDRDGVHLDDNRTFPHGSDVEFRITGTIKLR